MNWISGNHQHQQFRLFLQCGVFLLCLWLSVGKVINKFCIASFHVWYLSVFFFVVCVCGMKKKAPVYAFDKLLLFAATHKKTTTMTNKQKYEKNSFIKHIKYIYCAWWLNYVTVPNKGKYINKILSTSTQNPQYQVLSKHFYSPLFSLLILMFSELHITI